MSEKVYNVAGVDTNIYKYTLENGLDVYLIPYDNKNSYYIHYVTRFGSDNTEFIPIGEEKMVKVPDGIAHFLEHKMFESEDGITPFEFASKTGCGCNAATYHRHTRYLFEGSNGFKENLDYLLKYVHSPYFTDENVEKEKGIIAEELLQYKDMVDLQMELLVNKCLFKYDKMRIDIGGEVEDIMQITKEDLYKTYNTFYQPSNMFIVISGNFNKEEALEIIKNNEYLNKAVTNKEIIEKKIEEPLEVNERHVETEMNTQSTKVNYSIKVPIKDYKDLDRYKYVTYFGMMLSAMFGLSSDFRENIKKDEKVTSFYYDRSYTDDYMIITFFAITTDPNSFVSKVKEQLKDINVNEEDVSRIKKVWISSEIMMADDALVTLDNAIYDILEFGEVIDNKNNIFRSMNLEELIEIVNNVDYDNASVVIVNPKVK